VAVAIVPLNAYLDTFVLVLQARPHVLHACEHRHPTGTKIWRYHGKHLQQAQLDEVSRPQSCILYLGMPGGSNKQAILADYAFNLNVTSL
jgi:hypothetical protein